MANKTKTGDAHKKHYCSQHDAEAKPTKYAPGNKMKFDCPQGCSLTKQQTVKK